MSELKELLLDELADIYYAEKQLLKALPKMAKAAQSEELQEAFASHQEETENQIERAEQVFEALDAPVKSKKCDAMLGLLEEAKSIMDEWKGSPAIDAALISAAQKVEHYEIASYGTLCTWAKLLGNKEALGLLKATLGEEKAADQKLSALAEDGVNEEADEDGDQPPKPRSTKKAVKKKTAR